MLANRFRALHAANADDHYIVAGDINETFHREDTSNPNRKLDKEGLLAALHESLIDSLTFHESNSSTPRYSYHSLASSSNVPISSRLDYIFLSPSLISPPAPAMSYCQGTIDKCLSYFALNATLDHYPVLAQCQHPAQEPPRQSPESLTMETWQ